MFYAVEKTYLFLSLKFEREYGASWGRKRRYCCTPWN
jgi:hypothetical protein